MLSKQIAEKELQISTDREEFEEKMKKFEEDIKEFDIKKEQISAELESQLAAIKANRLRTEERKAYLAQITAKFDVATAALVKQIDELNAASDELLKLAQDNDALLEMEELPEFMVFEEEGPVRKPSEAPPPEPAAVGKKPHKKKPPPKK
jgi:uncharacterized protein YydD (DUF2326 family)